VQNLFDAFIYEEVTPAIRKDCDSEDIEIIATGASIGAFNAVATVCRHPDAFRMAIGMSGTYDLSKYLEGRMYPDFYFSSPLHYLPNLEGPQLELLRTRFILLPSGEGDYEDIGESWRLARVLGAKGVPNRVDPWGAEWRHDWVTWREMLPKYLAEFA
jgi:esterase/lipase superfamily enzyme